MNVGIISNIFYKFSSICQIFTFLYVALLQLNTKKQIFKKYIKCNI